MVRILYICVLFLLLFSACEKEVKIEIDPIASKLVVISNFNDGSNLSLGDTLMRVTVGKSTSAFSTPDTSIAYIPDAIVELSRGNQFLERLDYYEPTTTEIEEGVLPYYKTEAFEPVAGELYKLEVSAPNFSPVIAYGYIPFIESESEISDFSTIETETTNGFIDLNYNLDLKVKNLKLVENFYHVNLYQASNFFRNGPSVDTTSRTEKIFGPLVFNLLDHNKEVLSYIDNRGILIRDKDVNGSIGEFSIQGNVLYNPGQSEIIRFIVEVRNVSPDYYYYHSSLTRQERVLSGFDPINGPVVLYNNIEDGCGVFAGYATDLLSLDLAN